MNRHSSIKPATGPLGSDTGAAGGSPAPVAPNLSTVCTECDGTGFFVIGEFHPDDPRNSASYDCDNCGGTGEVESDTHCQCGEPLDDDLWCASCEALHRYEPGIGLVDVEMWREENGRFGVGA